MKNKVKLILILLSIMLFMGQVGINSFEHDFGKIKPDEYVYHTFVIENSSDDNLVVQNIQAG